MKIDIDKIKRIESEVLETIPESKWQWLLNNIKSSIYLQIVQNIEQKKIGDYYEQKYL
jgi:hypothetical protein